MGCTSEGYEGGDVGNRVAGVREGEGGEGRGWEGCMYACIK